MQNREHRGLFKSMLRYKLFVAEAFEMQGPVGGRCARRDTLLFALYVLQMVEKGDTYLLDAKIPDYELR